MGVGVHTWLGASDTATVEVCDTICLLLQDLQDQFMNRRGSRRAAPSVQPAEMFASYNGEWSPAAGMQVWVQEDMSPRVNVLGGSGTIKKINQDGTFSVKFILGSFRQRVSVSQSMPASVLSDVPAAAAVITTPYQKRLIYRVRQGQKLRRIIPRMDSAQKEVDDKDSHIRELKAKIRQLEREVRRSRESICIEIRDEQKAEYDDALVCIT